MNAEVCLAFLFGSLPPTSNSIHKIITKPVTFSNGKLEVGVGNFIQNTPIGLEFLISAVSQVDDVSLWIVNETLKQEKQIQPVASTKKLALAEPWHELKFTVDLF